MTAGAADDQVPQVDEAEADLLEVVDDQPTQLSVAEADLLVVVLLDHPSHSELEALVVVVDEDQPFQSSRL